MPINQIKNVFVPFAPDREGKLTSAVSYGLSLADKTQSHITFRILGHHYDPPYSLAPQFVGSLVAPANAEEKKRIDSAETTLQAQLTSSGLGYDVHSAQLNQADAVDLVARQGRLHDLTVIDSPVEYFALGRALVEELLFHTGRPVVVIPTGIAAFKAKRIVVAWDGTARAARALNDAMPLLTSAEYVELASVLKEKDLSKLVPGAEVAPHLSRHGIDATVVNVEAIDGDAGKALRERATLVGADMIVMGAFAHSRWRQMVLGGVTDSMLGESEIPVFLSH
ncbi:MAG: universal stress protein [Beijerinckiaceae bacterium]